MPRPRDRRRRQRGFTLIELMVVVAIIAVIVSVAVLAIRPGELSKSGRAYTERVTAKLEELRLRATTTRKWQRLEVGSTSVTHYQSTTEGMAVPVDWVELGVLTAPGGVSIYAFEDRTHQAPADPVPNRGDGIPGVIDFAPDGAGTAATIFITGADDDYEGRVTVFRATGAARQFDDF